MKKKTSNSFLLELGVEDLPARFLPAAQNYLKTEIDEWLKKQEFQKAQAQVWLTCRRIAVHLSGLPKEKQAQQQRFYGPRTDSLKDTQGQYLPQVLGFAKSKGIDPNKLQIEDTPKGRCVCAQITAPPVPLTRLLETEVLASALSIPFPKSMRWGAPLKFARPIRWITALWNSSALPWQTADLRASRQTWVLGNPVRIQSAPHYRRQLKALGVEIDQETRRESLKLLLKKRSRPATPWTPDIESLLIESADLVERPDVLAGSFDPGHLILPEEVIGTILSKSKLFCVRQNGKLAPKFLAVIEKPKQRQALKNIQEGYGRLVESRLRDAKFFWEQDLKIPLSSEERFQKLSGIVWNKGMGSVADKTKRVWAALETGDPQDPLDFVTAGRLKMACRLYKADLTTTLIGEYPELAGRAGAYYAKSDPNAQEASLILEDASKEIPMTTPAGLLVITDHLDSLLAHFVLGNRPGSKEDPLGLKRMADRIIELCWQSEQLKAVNVDARLAAAAQALQMIRPGEYSREIKDLRQYLKSRLGQKLIGLGLGPDRVEALMEAGHFQSGFFVSRVRSAALALKSLEHTKKEQLASLTNSFKRATNILRQANVNGQSGLSVERSLFEHPAEQRLFDCVSLLKEQITQDIGRLEYVSAFDRLSQLAEPLSGFFESVMVLSDKQALRDNRLALLHQIKILVLGLIDPSKLTLK